MGLKIRTNNGGKKMIDKKTQKTPSLNHSRFSDGFFCVTKNDLNFVKKYMANDYSVRAKNFTTLYSHV